MLVVLLTACGLVLVILANHHIEPTTYRLLSDDTIAANPPSYWPAWDGLKDIGIALLGIGGVGVVYEAIVRTAQEKVLRSLIADVGPVIGNDIAELIVGDQRFINEVLEDDQREDFLRKIVMAHLNAEAEPLARDAANQLSGSPILRNYTATYKAMDEVDGKTAPAPHAILEQSLVTNEQPNATFEFRFQVFNDEDTDKVGYGPDIFTWRYWRAPHEKIPALLDQFQVVEVKVDGVALDISPEKDRTEDSVTWYAKYKRPEAPKTHRFLVETVLRLPPPYEGGYVHLQPRALCQGVEIRCNVANSKFDAVPVETLRAHNIRIKKDHEYDGVKQRHRILRPEVRTDAWVLPTASVAFVFYIPTEDYNLRLVDESTGNVAGP